MKIRFLPLLLLFSCTPKMQVYESVDTEGKWVCEADQGRFVFSGKDAQNMAHRRCDTFVGHFYERQFTGIKQELKERNNDNTK